MQTLGLADSTTRSEGRLKSLFWPSIQSGTDVDYLAAQGFWVCTFVGVTSFIFLAFLGGQPITGLLVLLLFHLGGVGVREHNPFAAAVMLIFYVVDFAASFFLQRCRFTGHRSGENYHHRVAGIESPGHLDRGQLEA
jgi:hypothetical protein